MRVPGGGARRSPGLSRGLFALEQIDEQQDHDDQQDHSAADVHGFTSVALRCTLKKRPTADSGFGAFVANGTSGWEDGATASAATNLGLLGDVPAALERLNVPLFAVDRDGVVVWVNAAGRRLAGDVIGRRYTQWVAPESRDVVDRQFSRKVLGVSDSSDYEAVLQAGDGSRFNAEISSVSLDEAGHVVGVFGIVSPLREPSPPPPAAEMLTPRQAQVLHLLAQGASTQLIATQLGLSPETVRNHIRALFRRLGVHSRLEAVVAGHARGLV